MSKLTKALTAAAGNAGESLYVEDVFSTYLYTGNSAARSINNGIDLDGEGGLVWIKARTSGVTANHSLFDTERGIYKWLRSNLTAAELSYSNTVTAFNADGFDLGVNNQQNYSGEDYASWTFRKAEKFFDVVTWTGDDSSGRQIPHNLGSVPACIITKELGTTSEWMVYNSSLNGGVDPEDYKLQLNSSAGQSSGVGIWGGPPTDSVFIVDGNDQVNGLGQTYVAYLFASDAGGFGDDGSESIIKCGSYTGNGSTNGPEIDLGFEPQWLMVKNSTASSDWYLVDTMRGFTANTSDSYQRLMANLSNAEDGSNAFSINSTGFKLVNATYNPNVSGNSYIYIAIRRPIKTPESGTEVFGVRSYSETTDYQQLTTGNLADWGWQFLNGDGVKIFTRLIGKGYLTPTSDAAANTSATTEWDYMDGFAPYYANSVSGFSPRQVLGFTRASGFFDVVAWSGDGTSNRDINHNLGVTPELIIVKSLTNTDNWFAYLGSPFGSFEGDYMLFNSNGIPSSTNISNIFPSSPTSTTFRVGNERGLNGSGEKIVAYLLASVDGVSKIGTYSGSSSNVDVTLGFAPRLFIVKKLDSGTSGNAHWIMWNSALGIVAGNDPRIRISSGAYYASNDCIDPITNGIRVLGGVNGNFNEAGSEYSYIAIA